MNLSKWNAFLTEDVDEQPTRKDEYDTADVIVPKIELLPVVPADGPLVDPAPPAPTVTV